MQDSLLDARIFELVQVELLHNLVTLFV
jgi:hypothetical protein